MVEDDVLVVACGDGVVLDACLVAHTHTDVAHDDLVGIDVQRIAAQTDAVARSGLARDGEIWIGDNQFFGQ